MESKETVQISATIDKNLHQSVKDEAARDNRSFSQTVELLLGQSIKERERQRTKNSRKATKNKLDAIQKESIG